jgi:hypothetical protein
MAKFLTKELIKNANDVKMELVDVPEWGGKMYIKSLSAIEREELRKEIGEGTDKEMDIIKVQMKLLSLTIVGEDKVKLFTEEDVEWLKGKSAVVLDRLFLVSQKMAGLGVEATEEIAKN